jgi:signal peptidase I
MPEISSSTQPKNTHSSFKETIDSLIIAFILAFVFRAFGVEAFVIYDLLHL